MPESSAIEAIATTKRTPPEPPPAPVTAPAAQPSAPPVVAKTADDRATLSATAQMMVLKGQGMTVGEIAAVIGLPVSTVQANLGLLAANAQSTVTVIA